MRIRFCKQQDGFSCGPVALLNLMKWIGFNLKYREWIWIFRALCNTSIDGTYDKDFDRAIRKLSRTCRCFSVRKPKKKGIRKLRLHLNNPDNFAAIVGHAEPHPSKEWHYSFIIPDPDSDKWVAINFNDGKRFYTKKIIDPSEITKYTDTTSIWLIRKFRFDKT